ncbi:hypothetical protein OH717_01560 [Streptomyces albidoflavus]|uniref:hypothetical protein n=1 Tax=Streptomyces koyangensis TaxID=188770 RepID=UPI003D03AD46|nr:hypothetical protein OH717_01560 [Streptomyces albidoflavus]
MDSGLAAVLGAGITGVVASLGALLTYQQTKVQVRSNAKLALREPRRKIYGDFLTACREASDAVWGVLEEETREAPAEAIHSVLDGRLSGLRHLLADVDLEGPDAVSEAAHLVVDAFGELNMSALIVFETGEPSDEERRPVGFGGDITGDVREGLAKFVLAGRKALRTDADQRR